MSETDKTVTIAVDYGPEAKAFNDKFKPLVLRERKEGHEFLLGVSQVQWEQADMLAALQLPPEGIEDVFTYTAQQSGMSKATMRLRRLVGQKITERHPKISFSAYAELVRVTESIKTDDPVRDRQVVLAKFQGSPDNPVAPEDWTIENMKTILRGYYQEDKPGLGDEVLEKRVDARGIGRLLIRWSKAGIEVIVPKTADSGEAVIDGLNTITFKAKFRQPKSKSKPDAGAAAA
jgi:hypothetical protein